MSKKLKDAKEGQVVLIWIDKNGCVAVNNSRPGVKAMDGVTMIPATVIDSISGFGVTIGWKAGEFVPLSSVPPVPVPTVWFNKGIIVAHCYNSIVEYMDPGAKDAIRNEHPCKICKRKNDVGIGSCWWCGVVHPTDPTAR